MNKRTTILIVILFLITCGLLFLAIQTPPYQRQHPPLSPTPTPLSVNAKTTLSLVDTPASESSKTAQQTVSVVVDTNINPVNGVQIELAYDPTVLTNVAVAPGTFFKQPTILLKNINTTDGRVSYALTEQLDVPGHVGKGTVAYVSFDILPQAKATKTTIHFLPKSAVAADRILESVLRKTMDYTLQVPAVNPTLPISSRSAQ
jgi:hypothetical protein